MDGNLDVMVSSLFHASCINMVFITCHFIANDLGPQTQYYLPSGILNTKGSNTLAVAVIPIDKGAQLGKVSLEAYKVLESSIPAVELVESPGIDKRHT